MAKKPVAKPATKKSAAKQKGAARPEPTLRVETITHDDASRKNIPTAEYQSVLKESTQKPVKIKYPRNTDLDPQLVWRGKDEQDWSDLVVNAPPLYIQEKVHPKVLIDNLKREMEDRDTLVDDAPQLDLFRDFNGVPEGVDKTDFYQHDQHWSNRMILGDSLQVMASLAEREGLRGKVQCIYFDPPYGIKFNSNFQWSTTSNKGQDGKADQITREPEQVKAFRDTWRDGIHSYLSYLRDRLTVARDLLTESGSIFVQIGDENLHRVRTVMDEVFGEENSIGIIPFRKKTMPFGTKYIEQMGDYLVWYGRSKNTGTKYRALKRLANIEGEFHHCWYEDVIGNRKKMSKMEIDSHSLLPTGARVYRLKSLEPSGPMASGKFVHNFQGRPFPAPQNGYSTTPEGLTRLERANLLQVEGNRLTYLMYAHLGTTAALTSPWYDTVGADNKSYVVQTNSEVVKRCILMTTDPGDLVIDPTCGSGTTATVAEQWGRRWITIDTSRVALALARARIMGQRFPFYLLADSIEGQKKEADITRTAPSAQPVQENIRHGFVYERVPHTTLKSIANNDKIDEIWEQSQATMEPLRAKLNSALKQTWEEWEIPRDAEAKWSNAAKQLHTDWWQARSARQQEIDNSIAARTEFEFLYDKPYENKKVVRVAGPFTVESMSPHRTLGVDENDNLIDPTKSRVASGAQSFVDVILANLKTAGVQQADKAGKIDFTSVTPWPGTMVCAEGRYMEGDTERRAAIFIGPEFGTVLRADLVEAAKEAGDSGFDILIACAFSYEARTTDFSKLANMKVLKARMNADLHMAEDLKNTGKGNLFVVFGEPDIEIKGAPGKRIIVKINGVDVFHPNTGEIHSDSADGIACWFIDTDYNEESFFVRHAYFLGANDPYKSLKTSLKAEIDADAWATLNSDTSRPFRKPRSGRIAVKVINHLGDEVMKVFKVT